MKFESLPTVEDGGHTSIADVHPDIIRTHILARLDGPTLASATCASAQLHSLSSCDDLWRHLCHRNWPSTARPLIRHLISRFPAAHRGFYSDSFPTLHYRSRCRPVNSNPLRLPPAPRLVSAVDVHYRNKLILSKVEETDTVTGWFLCSPFRIDVLDQKEKVPAPVKFHGGHDTFQSDLEESLTLSWIIFDPAQNRAANFSSPRPVSVNRHWLSGDIQVRFATVLAGQQAGEPVSCTAVVTCGGREGGELQVKEVSFQVEDMEGKNLSGRESLVILQEAMELGERRREKKGEEREIHAEFLKMKKERIERKQRREKRLDMVCMATGVTIFLAWALHLLRRYS
ncbi:probable F-box protein At2g36090 [Diospyros lotus]|uniref:probable F-box protein At2g36090 n=1 Tax=Diospyros lotus TaxID=55363 RepID=UPI002251292A|nr:probable F-box protein At2g36090 [Diospyros lotus]